MAQEKTIAFNIDILGVSNEATELAKLEIQLKNIKKERAELIKQASSPGHIASNEEKQKLAAYNKEIGIQDAALRSLKRVIDSAADSLARKKALLIDLTAKSDKATQAIRDGMAPAIKKLNDEIKSGENARGVFSRNVGNYSGAFADAGKSMLSMLNPLALVGVAIAGAKKVFDGLKEAIMSTTFAMNVANDAGAVMKQLWYDIAITGKTSLTTLIGATKAQDALNKLRVEEGFETLKLSKINREMQAVRELSIDRTKTHAERLEYLTKVTELQSEKTKIQVEHLQSELKAKNDLLKQQPANEKLGLEILALGARINDVYAEEDAAMRRVNTQRTGFIQEQVDARKKLTENWYKEIEEQNEALENSEVFMSKIESDRLDKEKRLAGQRMNMGSQNGPLFGLTGVTAGKIKQETQESVDDIGNIIDKANANILKDQEEHDRKILELTERTSDSKINLANSAVSLLNTLGGKSKSIQKAALIAEKIVAIAQITMQARIANMATTAWGAAYSIPTLGASVIAAGIINAKNKITEIFNIGSVIASAAVSFARGGKINKGVPINTGTVDDTLIAVNKSETVLTQSHVARLGGSGVMRRIGVPGYAMGGYIGQQAPEIPSAGFDYAAMARLMNSIEVRLDINKVNAAQKEISVITETQRI